ncbi:MAG: MBL fold metallo-hydrolase [Acidimicrobiia bacterium]|nr:MBL fold metallo-hydrolase [Acidimicrobiia bacterium]
MELRVLGSCGSWPAPGLPSSGYVVADEETRIVMDLGFGTMPLLPDPLRVDAVVVSHRHPDHCADVLALYHLWAYGEERRAGIPLIAPQSTLNSLAAFVEARSGNRFWEVFLAAPVTGGTRRHVGSFDLTFFDVDHSVSAVATRIESRGRSLFYTGDTGMARQWWKAVPRSNLILSEASWQGDGDGGDYTQHLTAAQAGRIAGEIGADHLVVTHLKPGLDPVRSVAEAKTTFPGPVSHADPGRIFEV